MTRYDLLVRRGRVANAPGGPCGTADVAIRGGRIVALEPVIAPDRAREVVDADGRYILPGLVDAHVHLSGRFGSALGYRMLVQAGVTCALDLAGDPGDILRDLPSHGCGLTVGVLVPVIPGRTVGGDDPARTEVAELLDRSLAGGALGLKALGGHYPITPSALDHVIGACNARGVRCAVHAGSTESGSDVRGVEELVAIAGDRRVHVAHLNSYCRGQVEDPVAEAARVVTALRDARAVWSESYLATINGADGSCEGDEPASDVVRTCLRLGAYAPTREGLVQAIDDGWAQVHVEVGDGIRLAGAAEGRAAFAAAGTKVGVSFPVNPASSALALALARRPDRTFVVAALASDGGTIPRNTTLAQGMRLVSAGFLTLPELVEKAAAEPARALGLPGKGRLDVGADADLIVVDEDGSCRVVVIAGRAVFERGRKLERRGGRLLCTARGAAAAEAAGVPYAVPSAAP